MPDGATLIGPTGIEIDILCRPDKSLATPSGTPLSERRSITAPLYSGLRRFIQHHHTLPRAYR